MQSANPLLQAANRLLQEVPQKDIDNALSNPLIILSAPRSGSTLLFETLANQPGVWTIGGESHGVFAAFPQLRFSNANFDSGALDESHATPETVRVMRACFAVLMKNHEGSPLLRLPRDARPASPLLVEKTPRNALNVPFLLKLFPNARFLFLTRGFQQNIGSIADAWEAGLQTGRFVTYRDLPGWDRPAWCFLLPEGWRKLVGRPLVEIASFQWKACNEAIVNELSLLDRSRWMAVDYAALVASSVETFRSILSFSGLPEVNILQELPLSRTTLTPPDPNKWQRYEKELAALAPELFDTQKTIEKLINRQTG